MKLILMTPLGFPGPESISRCNPSCFLFEWGIKRQVIQQWMAKHQTQTVLPRALKMGRRANGTYNTAPLKRYPVAFCRALGSVTYHTAELISHISTKLDDYGQSSIVCDVLTWRVMRMTSMELIMPPRLPPKEKSLGARIPKWQCPKSGLFRPGINSTLLETSIDKHPESSIKALFWKPSQTLETPNFRA